jgi:hypothetical protein
MALDIGVGDGCSLTPMQNQSSLCLENDGVYWFLHPLFERLRVETGQYIDLYGDASFAGDGLPALKRMLAEARSLAESQPECWQVNVGTQVSPVSRELYEPVRREVLLALLAQWAEVVRRAEELECPVVCCGD